MAEVFAAVSGGAGLVSLALQLGDSTLKIKRLYSSAKQAPEALNNLSFELETFSLLLREVERNRQASDGTSPDVIARCIQMCENGVRTIRTTVDKLEALMLKSPRFGRFRSAVEEKELGQLCDILERAKTSLMLAFNLYTEAQRKRDSELIHASHTLAVQQFSIMQEQHELVTQRTVTTTTTMSTSVNIGCQRDSRSGTPQKSRWELRYRLQPWFCSRLWELSVQRSQSGWNIQLWTANIVPHDARIFRLCERGDLVGVRELFQRGLASPLDRSLYHQTVLEAAAISMNVELCQFILEILDTTAMGVNRISSALGHAAHPNFVEDKDAERRVSMYRLLVSRMDIDFENLEHQIWWRLCPNTDCMRILQNALPTCYQDLPLSLRFEHSMALIHPASATYLLQSLGCSLSEPRLASARTSDGRTLLHFIAIVVFREAIQHNEYQQWKDMTAAFIANGGQLHSRNDEGFTAMQSALARNSGEIFLGAKLREWVRLLDEVGVNLKNYGDRERELWGGPQDSYIHVVDWTFGAKVQDWEIVQRMITYVPIYELQSTPGEWRSPIAMGGQILPWSPMEEDSQNGALKWQFKRSIRLISEPLPTDRRGNKQEDSFSEWVRNSQDDAGEVARLVHATSRPWPRPRSQSQPRMRDKERDTRESEWYTGHSWLRCYHICPCDFRRRLIITWEFDPDNVLRKCMLGNGHDTGIQARIRSRLRGLREEFSSREELERLSPEIYKEYGF